MTCHNCGPNEDIYVLSFEKGQEDPAQIDYWTNLTKFREDECIATIRKIDILAEIEMEPFFFCANCHSTIPRYRLLDFSEEPLSTYH
jgi:RNA polymerase-binding transcription factor DksA